MFPRALYNKHKLVAVLQRFVEQDASCGHVMVVVVVYTLSHEVEKQVKEIVN